uniref:hypothetical protein n=1 Tax=uncultured Shewanella sp. TaxID=173975 RepID=UPI00260AA339
MNNTHINDKLAKYFQSGDVPTEAQFGQLIDAALDLSVNKSMVDTQVIRTVDVVLEDNIANLDQLTSAIIEKYALLDGQTILLAAQQNAVENGIYLFDGSACTTLYTTTVNENIANLGTLAAEQISRLQLMSGTLVRLNAQSNDAENGIYRYALELITKTVFIKVNENITELTDIPTETVDRLSLTDNGYYQLTAQTASEANGLYQFISNSLIKLVYTEVTENIADLSQIISAQVSEFALSSGSWVLLQGQSNPVENGLYRCNGAFVDKQIPYYLGYALKEVKLGEGTQALWFIYQQDNETQANYWKQRFDLSADNITAGTLDNARLPSQIDLTQGDMVTGTQVKATQIKADTF